MFYNIMCYYTHIFRCKITTNIWNTQGFLKKKQIYLEFFHEKPCCSHNCADVISGMEKPIGFWFRKGKAVGETMPTESLKRRSPKLLQINQMYFFCER